MAGCMSCITSHSVMGSDSPSNNHVYTCMYGIHTIGIILCFHNTSRVRPRNELETSQSLVEGYSEIHQSAQECRDPGS